MAKTFFIGIMLIAFIVAFLASVAGVISTGRLLAYLRKLEPSTYQKVGGPFLASFGSKPEFHKYLSGKSYRTSTHEPIRRWGEIHHVSVATMIAAVVVGLISSGLGQL